MHIPDGFLDAKVAGSAALASVGGLWLVLRRVPSGGHRKVPLMGVCAAFVFVAQMVNFPVAAGTSGHLVGAVLMAVLLGPWASALVMTAVLLVQALLFADGGVLTLGANIFNMAFVAVFAGHAVQRVTVRAWPTTRGFLFGTALASWASIVAASAACAVELSLSGMARMDLALPAMMGVHAFIGLGEALITTLVVAAVARARPDLVKRPTEQPGRRLVLAGLAASAVVLALTPFASSAPDGLEKVAEQLGFSHRVEPLLAASLVPETVSMTALAGLVGATLASALALGLSRALTKQRES